ncbi:maltokinase N-terminal cap-like domain-containing protein [Pedococcus sp. 5OH_020]|uniref:maltokinase N-terminal cap-like domain-containing protein n=1 Tax=Pedococcus sp. 5OH_020 TaxID=2989814 RepID=UPI0022E9EFF6|nr:aminoglycoside phosphotransferase [Pedococcus sp. 5OH_020]
MAEIHQTATLTPTKVELVEPWMARQRWYAAKGRLPRLRKLWSWRLDDPAGEVGIETLLLVEEGGDERVIYQVPLTYRAAPLDGGHQWLVGTMEHSVLGPRWVYDGVHDPVYAAQLLALVLEEAVPQSSAESATPEPAVVARRHPSWTTRTSLRSSRVLSGEQSNSSIIFESVDETGAPKPLICKVFRTLQAGENPDVTVQGALSEAGSTRVPGMVGAVSATWPGLDDGDEPSWGHLAFAQEFFPGTEDAWRVALRAVAADEDFSGPAGELGAATAEVHARLAEVMQTWAITAETVAAVVAGMRSRYAAAASEVPALAAHEQRIAAVFDRAADTKWPALQRIHGDYHLGQVLQVAGRGWVLLDFEGEPLRPLAERNQPDLAVRDVAGMLRSFDYAGGSWEQAHEGRSARAWVQSAQDAFLRGYAAESGRDPREDSALLTAFQLDKALYEVVYEARNRPTWLTIPTTAVVRLLDDARKDPL